MIVNNKSLMRVELEFQDRCANDWSYLIRLSVNNKELHAYYKTKLDECIARRDELRRVLNLESYRTKIA